MRGAPPRRLLPATLRLLTSWRRLAWHARRHFLIPLVNAERAWAHAMELKALAARGGEDSARKHHHAIKRLSKAAAWAAQLASLAASRADARTALEAEAYSSWMARGVAAAAARRDTAHVG